MKIFFWTMVAVVAGIYVYSRISSKKPLLSRRNPAEGTVYKDSDGIRYAGPDVDAKTGAYAPPDARLGTVEFPAQGN